MPLGELLNFNKNTKFYANRYFTGSTSPWNPVSQ